MSRKLWPAFALLLLLAGCGDAEPKGRLLDRDLSEVRIHRLEGTDESLRTYRGKVVVINFWGTWCPPCRHELPALQRLSDDLDPSRFAVLGIAVREQPLRLASYLREKGIAFARHIDLDDRLFRELAIEMVPTTLVLDTGGRVVKHHVGPLDHDLPQLKRQLGL